MCLHKIRKIEGDLGKLSEAILNFTNQKNINQFASVIKMASTFSKKINQGLSNKNIYFKTDFGHSIEYYDGIMFEVKDRKNNNNKMITGGRYDSLLLSLGLNNKASAIGFAVNNNNI